MAFGFKSPAQITEMDLAALIEGGETEGKTIDYKRDRIGTSDGDRKEFLYDISSFANAAGGQLVIGMEEVEGKATALHGLTGINPDAEIARLEQMARDGIRPPIPGLQSAAIPLAAGGFAIVVFIPQSWNPPHQVTYQKAFRFYGRDTNGKYQIDATSCARCSLSQRPPPSACAPFASSASRRSGPAKAALRSNPARRW
jgi:predicted HTH transcriptional regulator